MLFYFRVRADTAPRGRPCPRGRECFIPGNFKKDATVRPSHGRSRGHRPTVGPFVRRFVGPLSSARQPFSQVVVSEKSGDSASPESYHEIVMNAHPASHSACLP
jgi:hypothetical protein